MKRYQKNSGIGRLAVAVVLFAATFGGDVVAQDQATQPAAERIERMLDASDEQAVAVPTLSDVVEGGPAGADAGIESEAPLPPNEALPLGTSSSGLFESPSSDVGTSGGLGGNWLISTLAALGIVIALVFGLRWMLRRGGVVASAAPQGSVVEVLSRTTVAPRSHVVLMRVGQRILVVNDSSAGMRTLATVEDPEEVAELLGAVDASRPTSMANNFSSVMGRLSGQWSSSQPELGLAEVGEAMQDEPVLADGQGAVSSVRGRLRSLASSGGGLKA